MASTKVFVDNRYLIGYNRNQINTWMMGTGEIAISAAPKD